MVKKNLCFIVALVGALFLSVTNCYSFGDFGTDVNTACAPEQPFTGDCALCHTGGFGASTPAKDAYLAGGNTLLDFFCPAGPTCTDVDGDGYGSPGDASCANGSATDCNDGNAAVNPGAAENCTDTIDNDCDGLIDAQDPDAVGCPPICTDDDGDGYAVEGGACGQIDCDDTDAAVNPGTAEVCDDGADNNCNGAIDEGCGPVCTDSDGDGFAAEGGACGQIDCDDTDAAVNPAAVEDCTDGIDNNCNGLVDTSDGTAVNCPPACTDNDGDSYATEGGACGPVDCDDNDPTVNPGATESCDDGADNDCDGTIDEGCDPTCPDVDGDGFLDAACGGTDCDDSDAAINPGTAEVCGNSIDENCNGSSDDVCTACPDGGVLVIKEAEYNAGDKKLVAKGRSHINTTITLVDAETGNALADNIEVKDGKWKVKIKNLDPSEAPDVIRAINSEGCSSADLKIKKDRKDEDDEEEDEEKDD